MVIETLVKQAPYGLTDFDMKLIVQLGLPTKIISQNLNIPDGALRVRIARIGAKLGAENRTAIVVMALSLGLVTLDQLVYRVYDAKH